MNTLIKPPCTNKGCITEEQQKANAYLAGLLNGNKKKASITCLITRHDTCNIADDVRGNYAVPIFQNDSTGKVYTFGEIYTACVKINKDSQLTPDELDGFLEDLIGSVNDSNFIEGLNISLEHAIRTIIAWTPADIESVLDSVVSDYDTTEAYEDEQQRKELVKDMLETIQFNPFTRVWVKMLDMVRDYDFID